MLSHAEEARHLHVVIPPRMVQGRPKDPFVPLHLLHHRHAAAPDERAVLHPRADEKETTLGVGEEQRVTKAHPPPPLVEAAFVELRSPVAHVDRVAVAAHLVPRVQVLAQRQTHPLHATPLHPGKTRVEHPPLSGLVRIGADVHRPQRVVVPVPGMADEQGVVHPVPVEAILAHRVRDEIVVGQNQVKQVELAPVVDHIDIADVPWLESDVAVHAALY